MNGGLLSAIISLGHQLQGFREFAQYIGAAIGFTVFGWQFFGLIRRSRNPHAPGTAAGNISAMVIASLLSSASLWGAGGFSAVSDDPFGNVIPAATVLNYYGVPPSADANAVLDAVFSIIEAFGWWAVIAGACSFISASSLAASGSPVDGSHVWKGLLRWIGGSMCISIGWTAIQLYQSLSS